MTDYENDKCNCFKVKWSYSTQRDKINEKVHKPPLRVNLISFKLNGFNASIWVPWSSSDPKTLRYTDRSTQIHKICVKISCMFAPTI